LQKGKAIAFQTESTGYEKTILSDLQGAWVVLRESVANSAGFEGGDRALFHIDIESIYQEDLCCLTRQLVDDEKMNLPRAVGAVDHGGLDVGSFAGA
jgi:hypothetical protein